MNVKKTLAKLCASTGLAVLSLIAVAGPASAGTISMADCLAKGGEVKDHSSWTGCHGTGMGSSGTKIV